MSGYRHSGLTQQEYEEREILRAADEIRARRPEPKPASVRAEEFRSARESLIETMTAYGVDPGQARIQVGALVTAVRMLNVEDL
jgi:hypothetical protein